MTQQILLYYYRYKEFITPVVIIVTCCILFLAVIIPQFFHVRMIQTRITDESKNVHILQDNFQHVSSLDDAQLDAQFQLAVSAFPPEKNVISILNAISSTASRANVSLQDYNFGAGDLAMGDQVSKIEIVLSINGTIQSIQQFIHQLNTSLPLSNVVTVKTGNNGSSSITVDFFTKSFSKASFDENVPLQLLTPQDEATLNTLASWQHGN